MTGAAPAALVPLPLDPAQVQGLHRLRRPHPEEGPRHAGEGVPPPAGSGRDYHPEVQ